MILQILKVFTAPIKHPVSLKTLTNTNYKLLLDGKAVGTYQSKVEAM